MRESLCWHCNKSSTSDLCSWVAELRPPPGVVMKGNLIIDCPQFDGERPRVVEKKYTQKKNHKKVCQQCGKTFMTANINQRYCSIACANVLRNHFAADREKICPICGSTFMTKSVRQKYCGEECVKAAKRESYRKWRERKKGR